MPRQKALPPMQAARAAELYRDEGKSRRQVAAILDCSETAVTTALRGFGIKLRPQKKAAAAHNKSKRGFYRKSQLVASVFHLGANHGQLP